MVLLSLIHAHDPDVEFERVDPIWLQTWVHRNARTVARDGRYPFLQSAERKMRADGSFPIEEADLVNRFLLLRARPDHEDCWLTNRLLSTLVPADFVSRFVFDKQGFYGEYANYSEDFVPMSCIRC